VGLALFTFVLTLSSRCTCGAPATAVFGMGCFWCGEEALQKIPGVMCAESGYAGGELACPTYYSVVRGGTGHLEAVRVVYDDEMLTYDDLLRYFWHNVNPLQDDGQFCDNGESYNSAIFYQSPDQEEEALASKAEFEAAMGWTALTEVRPVTTFYVAESNHQNYFLTSPTSYNRYKTLCRRVSTLKAVWGKDAYEEYNQNTIPVSPDAERCAQVGSADERVLVEECSSTGSSTGGSTGTRGGSLTGGIGNTVNPLSDASAGEDSSITGGSDTSSSGIVSLSLLTFAFTSITASLCLA